MKKTIYLILTVVLFFSFVSVETHAAGQSDLSFTLNSDGESYYVSQCSNAASGELTIPETYDGKPVTGIGRTAFYYCSGLTGITIPDSIISIGDNAFTGCSSLTNITIPDSVTTIGGYAFSYCSGLTDLTIGDGVTDIGSNAFTGCGSLTELTIGKSVASIGNSAFYSCRSLKSITIPDSVTSIGANAFNDCISLTNIVIPNGVATIADSTFYNCKDLTSITIPDSVTTIGGRAFSNCESLTSITIPDGVTAIGSRAFAGCRSLNDITIPDGVTVMNENTFSNCTGLTNITIPDSITAIRNYVFSGCRNLAIVQFQGNAPAIDRYAFSNVLVTAYYPANDETWTEEMRQNYGGTVTWVAYESDDIPDVLAYGDCGDNLTWKLKTDGTMIISGTGDMWYWNRADAVPWHARRSVINKVVIESGVTDIGDYAFSDSSNLTSAILGNDVDRIGSSAFRNCAGLTEITIPDSVRYIDPSSFSYCTGLTELVLPEGVINIFDYAFSGCTGLTEITLPDSLSSIGEYAFADCSGLTSINIPRGVISIYRGAFSGCTALTGIWVDDNNTKFINTAEGILMNRTQTELVCVPGTFSGSYVIPDSVTTIGSYAFSNCSSLTGVTIPNSVTRIKESAFKSCSGLTKITIPGSVTSIEDYALSGCSGLKEIHFKGSAPAFGRDLFGGVSATAYYDREDGSWSNVVNLYYGGNISWVPYGNGYTVEFLDWDGSVIATRTYQLGQIIEPPADPVRAADEHYTYTFAGWELQEQDRGPSTPVIPLTLDLGVCNGDATYMATYDAASIQRTVTWIQASTSLEGNIGLNFYVKLSDSLINDPSTVMRFTINGETVDVPLADADVTTVDGETQYRFTCPINAKNMADNVNAQIVTADGPVGDAKNLAVMTYCNYMIQNSNDAELVRLMKAMLNYGAAAQILFNHNTDNLANASLSEADKQLADVDASAYAHSATGSEDGIQVHNATLILETETTIRIYFKLTGSKSIDQFTFKVDGVEVEPQPNGDLYYVEIPDIAAQDLDQMHTINVGGITVKYGGLSYVNQVLNYAGSAEALVNTAKALFAYNKLAEAYFN